MRGSSSAALACRFPIPILRPDALGDLGDYGHAVRSVAINRGKRNSWRERTIEPEEEEGAQREEAPLSISEERRFRESCATPLWSEANKHMQASRSVSIGNEAFPACQTLCAWVLVR